MRFTKRIFTTSVVLLALLTSGLSGCSKPATSGATGDTGKTETAEKAATSETKTDTKTDAKAEEKPATKEVMTEVGTPRNKTLIMDIGKDTNAGQFNPYMPGTAQSNGLHQLASSHLWEIDSANGKQIPVLAADMPVPNADFTKFQIKLREGITWSDGEKFTADDVVFTGNLLLTNKQLTWHGMFSSVVKSVTKVSDYEITIETIKPYPRLSYFLGVLIWGSSFYILPEHVWKDQDAATFKFDPPVHTGPYKLAKYDPQGSWFLWERREDWKNSDVGVLDPSKEPGPQFIWCRNLGDEQKRVMAMANHEIDVMLEISPESWEALQKQNPTARMWHKTFPYAIFDDPCGKGIEFNTSKKPYDSIDFRWGMALAVDIKQVSLGTLKGMLRVNPLLIPPTDALQKVYHKPMRDWLTNFALADGYKPFDPNYAVDIAKILKEQQNVTDLPTEEDALVDLFGVGWWKHDPQKAAELLTKAGLEQKDGKWFYEGKPFTFEVIIPGSTEIEAHRLGKAMADEWRKFGIDAVATEKTGADFGNLESTGEFEVGSYWPGCGIIPDVYNQINGWDKALIKPNGERAVGVSARWSSDKLTASLDKLKEMPTTDPELVPTTTEFLKTFVTELPYINCFGQSKFVPVDEYYWTGFPTAENAYNGPWWWWSAFKHITTGITPAPAK